MTAGRASAEPMAPHRAPDDTIPAYHFDLFARNLCAVLTTMGRGGQPQSSLVWVELADGCPRVNTTLDRQKGRNLLHDPRVSLLIVDPDDTGRFIQVRGDAGLTTRGAIDHLDALTQADTGRPHYYGGICAVEQAARETRVICRIHPRRVTLDAIHAGRTD